MWRIFKKLSQEHLPTDSIRVVSSGVGTNVQKLDEYEFVVLGGGSLISPKYIRILAKALDAGKRVVIWGSGIDRIGEKQYQAMDAGGPIEIRGRFNREDALLLRRVFAEASYAGIRGPYTKKALVALGVNPKHVRVIGDPGVLLEPVQPPHAVRKRIGINWGAADQSFGPNGKAVQESVAEAVKALIDRGYEAYVYAVYRDDLKSCQKLCEKIGRPARVKLETRLLAEQELMTELSSCQFTINYKLHPNVVSLAAGVPCIALAYRFKVFDLMTSLDLKEFAVSMGAPNLRTAIEGRIGLIDRDRDAVVAKYRANAKLYAPLLKQPFKKLFRT